MAGNLSAAEQKALLMRTVADIKMEVNQLTQGLRAATPIATQLILWKEIEKLSRQLERVQMGVQELVL